MAIDPTEALETRAALPEALRALLDHYPRAGWAADPGFQGLVQFWLDRHQMFRSLMLHLQVEAETFLDGGSEAPAYARRLSRQGGMFTGELEGHHQIEDHHYFPRLAAREPRLLHGFTILDTDHHALDSHLAAFVQGANTVLRLVDQPAPMRGAVGQFHAGLIRLGGFLERHLIDEEDLIVPVILKHGEASLS